MRQNHMRVRQAAEYLGVTVMTLFRWREEGRGPDWTRIAGMVIYDRKALDRFVEAEYDVYSSVSGRQV